MEWLLNMKLFFETDPFFFFSFSSVHIDPAVRFHGA
jgi:hypothetical protein